MIHCDIKQFDTIKCDTYQCDTLQGDTIQCDTSKGDIIQYDINQYVTNHCDTISGITFAVIAFPQTIYIM